MTTSINNPIETRISPLNFSFIKVLPSQYEIKIHHSTNNCKLTYLEQIGFFRTDYEEGKTKSLSILKTVLFYCRCAVSLNTPDINVAKLIEENFELYSIVKIPIGYYEGYQYHIIIRNPNSTHTNINMRATEYVKGSFFKEETKKVVAEKPIKEDIYKNITINYEKLKKSLVKFFRANKRKTDLMDNIIQMIKEEVENKDNPEG